MSEHAKDILAEVFIGIFACAILASPFIWAMARLG